MIDPFETAFEVAKHWLPAEERTGNMRQDVLRALSRPHVTDPAKAARRLTIGWIIATPDGGHHRLPAAPLRPLSNRVALGERIEAIIGDQSIGTPTIIVKLAKAGLTDRNFHPSYGDTLRINEAGKPPVRIDLAHVRELTRLSWRTKPSAKWLHQARRALQQSRFGDDEAKTKLPRPPFTEDPHPLLQVLERITPEEITYAIAVLITRREA